MKTVITAAHLITPSEWIEPPAIVIEDGHIAAVGSLDSVQPPAGAHQVKFPGLVLAPGFIDLHVHGGAGHDVMEPDTAARAAFERHMARHGVTSYLPTTVTAPSDRILAAIEGLGGSTAPRRADQGPAFPLGLPLA